MQSQLGKVPSSSSKSKSHRLGKSIPLADESKSYSIVSASCSGREPKYGSGCRPPLSYSVRSPFRRCSCAGVVEATSKNVSLVSRSVQLLRHIVLRLCKMLHLASSQLTLLLSRAEHFPESNFMPSPDVHPTMNITTKHGINAMAANKNPWDRTGDRSVEFECRMVKVEAEYRFAFHKFEYRFAIHKSWFLFDYFRVGSKSTKMKKPEKRKNGKKRKKREKGQKAGLRAKSRGAARSGARIHRQNTTKHGLTMATMASVDRRLSSSVLWLLFRIFNCTVVFV